MHRFRIDKAHGWTVIFNTGICMPLNSSKISWYIIMICQKWLHTLIGIWWSNKATLFQGYGSIHIESSIEKGALAYMYGLRGFLAEILCDQVTQVGGFICIVGRPLLHKPSTCPQSTENRSLCRGGTRHYIWNWGAERGANRQMGRLKKFYNLEIVMKRVITMCRCV